MRDVLEFITGLLTVRENPFLMRSLRVELRHKKLVRNHAILLSLLVGATVLGVFLVGRYAYQLRSVGYPPGVAVLGLVAGVHAWATIIVVSYRARAGIDLESRQQVLDLVRTAPIPEMRAMGMRATYPLLFGVAMVLPALPLYVAIASLGGVHAIDLLLVYFVLALVSVRPSGQSGAWYTRQLLSTQERKKQQQQRNAGMVVAIQVVTQGWVRLAPMGYLGSPVKAMFMPITWVVFVGQALVAERSFYDASVPIILPLLIALPFLWTALARSTHDMVTAQEGTLRWRANPAWAVWIVILVVMAGGYIVPLALRGAALALWAGGPSGSAASAMSALLGLVIAAWTTFGAMEMLFTGRGDAGLWPCGGDLATDARQAVRSELRSIAAAVSTLWLPLLAVALVALSARVAPEPTFLARVALCSVIALLLCYAVGRACAVHKLATGNEGSGAGVLAAILLLGLPIAALFPATRLPEQLLLVHPFAGFLLASPELAGRIASNPTTVSALPGIGQWLQAQAVLVPACVAWMVWFAAKQAGAVANGIARRKRLPRPTVLLIMEESRPLQALRNPITLRLVRSKPGSSSMGAVISAVCVVVVAGIGWVIYDPLPLGAAAGRAGLLVPRGASAAPGDSLVAAFVIGLALLLLIGTGGSIMAGLQPLLQERLRNTIGQILLLPLSSLEILTGFAGPAVAAIGAGMAILLVLPLLGMAVGASPVSFLIAVALAGACAVDLLMGVALGVLSAAKSPRGVYWPAPALWAVSRMAVTVALAAALLRPRGLLIEQPLLWLMVAAEGLVILGAGYLSARQIDRMRRGEAPLTEADERSAKRGNDR